MNDAQRVAVSAWLFIYATLVPAAATLWGYVRLKEIGLSITEWKPRGTDRLPPQSASDWQREFEGYVGSTAFQKQGKTTGLTLADFKHIYLGEWAHRWVTRVGLVGFLAPWAYFAIRGFIPRRLNYTLGGLFGLTVLQGLAGPAVTAVGLGHWTGPDPNGRHAAHFRYNAQLLVSVFLFAVTQWTAMSVRWPTVAAAQHLSSLRPATWLTIASTLGTLLTGGLTAGPDVEMLHREWPGLPHRLPPLRELLLLIPGVRNRLDDDAAQRGHHRLFAFTTVGLLGYLMWKAGRVSLPLSLKGAMSTTVGAIATQAALGAFAAFYAPFVPVVALHQGGAFLVLGSLLRFAHGLRSNPSSF